MGFHVDVFPDEPIVMAHLDDSFSIAGDLDQLITTVVQILDSVSQPVFYIANMGRIRMSFEDVVSGASTAARGAGAFLHHPNIRETLLITSDKMLLLSVQGLRSPVFGLENVSVFPTPEQALIYARAQVAAESAS